MIPYLRTTYNGYVNGTHMRMSHAVLMHVDFDLFGLHKQVIKKKITKARLIYYSLANFEMHTP